jgi:adenine phosphoribosyltransferase
MLLEQSLADFIRHVPDFPAPGVEYHDITPLLCQPRAFQDVIDALVERYRGRPLDAIVGVEARGLIFSAPLAYRLSVSLVPVRRNGRLPAAAYEVEYDLHFGADRLQLHRDALQHGARVVVIDDLLASGRTLAAACELVKMASAYVEEVASLIELTRAKGRERLADYQVFSLIQI